MHCFQTERIPTPIGEMVLIARDGVVLLLEFVEASDRVARELKARFGNVGFSPRMIRSEFRLAYGSILPGICLRLMTF